MMLTTAYRLRFLLRHTRRFSSSTAAVSSSLPDPNRNSNPNSPNEDKLTKSLGRTIDSLLQQSDLDKLVSDFIKCSDNAIFRSKRGVYEVSVRRLAAAGRTDCVELLLEAQKKHLAEHPNEGFAARIISLYGRAGMPGHAAATFRQLPSLNCPRTTLSFNSLLTAFSLASDRNAICEAFKDIPLEDPSIVPNAISFNILILAHLEKSDFDAAIDALNLMEASGVEPTTVTFNTLLNGLYKTGRFDDGEKIWAKMAEKGVKPDVWSYNAKLRGLANQKQISEMPKVIDELKNAGLEPDTYTFNELIKGYCEDGKLAEADKIYRELGKKGCHPNRWTFELLVPKFCEAGDFDKALKLSNASISQNCCVGVETLQSVVDGLTRSSRFEDAKRLVERAKLKSFDRKKLKMPLACLAV